MFAFRRGRLPFLIPLGLAVAFGYLLAGGVGSVLGVLLFLPLLIMKIVFTMLFFGFLFKMFAYRSGFADHRGAHRGDRRGGPRHQGWPGRPEWSESREASDPEPDREDRDWEEALRAAKREIDKLFPNPGDGDDAGDEDRER